MADRTAGGSPSDDRAYALRSRRLAHEIATLDLTVEKLEIDILQALDNIERTKASIEATKEQAKSKRGELDEMKAQEEIDG